MMSDKVLALRAIVPGPKNIEHALLGGGSGSFKARTKGSLPSRHVRRGISGTLFHTTSTHPAEVKRRRRKAARIAKASRRANRPS